MKQAEQIGDELWVVDGPVAKDLLVIPYPTRMTIARLSDGGLWVSSPIPSSLDLLNRLTELGPVSHLVSATPRHHWRLEDWHSLFPDARLWSCRLSPFTLGSRKLPVTTLDDAAPAAWSADLDQASLRGVGFNEVVFLHRASGTLLVDDVVQSHEHHPGKPLVNAVVRLGGLRAPGGVARDIRATIRVRDAARAWAERVLTWSFDQLVMAHGPVIRTGAKTYFEKRLDWLLG